MSIPLEALKKDKEGGASGVESAAAAPPLPAAPLVQVASPWQVYSFTDAMNQARQAPPWTIQDLLLEQTATLVSAHPHAMKSLSWLQACMEAPAFHTVWGHFKADAVERTLFVETEDPTWLVEARIRGIAKGLNIQPTDTMPGFHYVCPGPFNLVGGHKDLRDVFEIHKPQFAVLSTLQNLLAGRSWLQQDEMQPVMEVIINLARAYCPIVLLTHSPWDRKQHRAAGTVTQAANFVTSLHYEKVMNRKTAKTFAHVQVDSKAGAVESDFHLALETDGDESDPGSVRKVIYGGKGWPKGIGKAAVLAALEDDPDGTDREISERSGVSERYVRTVRAKRRGRAKHVGLSLANGDLPN